jgi:hypothetical protein
MATPKDTKTARIGPKKWTQSFQKDASLQKYSIKTPHLGVSILQKQDKFSNDSWGYSA